MSSLSLFLARVALAIRRVVLALAGLVFVAVLLLVGLTLGLVLLLWALLRGRRPSPMNLRWGRGARGMPGWATGRQPSANSAEVVDIQAREVPAAVDANAPVLPRQPR
ncbi:hypothetical protein LRH25_10045 [Ideonella azotifigens]|uniref:Uncharacterized protein n=1 Tax=Ideonella azotifigens TaxID=513160 RepID=A0ABN1KEQ1_9BURK|nr:hypothetical protein [Ideonella azotifigens]MCD2340685.1 hypothetical protein [Ideonella azotifigens]